jgi:GT2 family glycosyltransferase
MNDQEDLEFTLEVLLLDIPPGEGEVIVIDNGSFTPITYYPDPRLTIVRNQVNIGVGGAFNQGVEMAKANKVVLMGSDTIPQEGWFERVQETLKGNRTTIFNCLSSGFTDKTKPFHPKARRRYGAHVLYKMTIDDLPKTSILRDDPKFSRILQAKWNFGYPELEFTPVRCLLGAFYWMYKSQYQKIHGWNGHRMWGSLEPFLSIKARAHGMHIIVDAGLEAAHHYSRSPHRPSRPDLQYYNMLFMAHTMFSDALRDELIEHLRYGGREEKLEKLNVNQARVMIKRSNGLVQAERDYNNKHFKHGLISNWEKFNNEMI